MPMGTKMKWMWIIFAYAYCPLIYLTVYIPLVLPRLDHWSHIPFWILMPLIIGFVIIIAAFGIRRSHRSILINSFGIALVLQAFSFSLSRLHMPGFHKFTETGFIPDSIKIILISGIFVFIIAEFGRILGAKFSKQICSING